MCWGDFDKAKRLKTRPTVLTAGASVELAANPDRVGLFVTGNLSGGDNVIVRVPGTGGCAIANLTGTTPNVELSVLRHGQFVMGAIQIENSFPGDVGVTEIILEDRKGMT